jgi:hypothetical protein
METKSVFLKDVFLNFNLQGIKTFEIMSGTSISETNKPPVKHHASRKISIERIIASDNSILFDIKCLDKKIQFGGYLRKAQELCLIIAGIYDNLMVEANNKGELITLHNLADIRKEYEMVKEKLPLNYDGIEFHDYLIGLSNKLNNANEVLEELKQPNFLGLFFNGIYRCYIEYQTIDKATSHYGLKERITIDETHSLIVDEANPNSIMISFAGSFKSPNDTYVINSQGYYIFNEATNWICEAKIQLDEKLDNTTRKTSFQLKEIQ